MGGLFHDLSAWFDPTLFLFYFIFSSFHLYLLFFRGIFSCSCECLRTSDILLGNILTREFFVILWVNYWRILNCAIFSYFQPTEETATHLFNHCYSHFFINPGIFISQEIKKIYMLSSCLFSQKKKLALFYLCFSFF